MTESLWTKSYRLSHQRTYRQAFIASGGRRIDLYIDGKLNAQLEQALSDYSYESHPGAAIARFLKDYAEDNEPE